MALVRGGTWVGDGRRQLRRASRGKQAQDGDAEHADLPHSGLQGPDIKGLALSWGEAAAAGVERGG